MKSEDIIKAIKLTGKLMELHNENPFKVKSFYNAAFKLDKTAVNIETASLEELESMDGIGKGMAQKIIELQTTGELKELNSYLAKTPSGVVEMLGIRGIGPKKVGQLWRELNLESVGELLYACTENRLITLKGFGAKTQDALMKEIEFRQQSAGKFHYAKVERYAISLVDLLKEILDTDLVSLTGAVRRKCEVLDQIDILAVSASTPELPLIRDAPSVRVNIIPCSNEGFYSRLFETTASPGHLAQMSYKPVQNNTSEEKIYSDFQMQYVEPELREGLGEVELARSGSLPRLIGTDDLRGVLHCHSTYSDGANTLEEMAVYCKENGFQYLGICDHSQSAFYANGMRPERVLEQHLEIEALNIKMAPFVIFKGIESDILNDGSLDYAEDILRRFDFVVASVHSNLKMNLEKATARLLKAIENPYTTILGHPTGRLLLYREGYPIDHQKVIDACAANGVVIELNANPYRLDIDWRWIDYCLKKDVRISINPDAHSKKGCHDIYYGVCVARKGMLTRKMCLNSLTSDELKNYFNIQHLTPNT
jgi:DNA polymerase (family 10)